MARWTTGAELPDMMLARATFAHANALPGACAAIKAPRVPTDKAVLAGGASVATVSAGCLDHVGANGNIFGHAGALKWPAREGREQ